MTVPTIPLLIVVNWGNQPRQGDVEFDLGILQFIEDSRGLVCVCRGTNKMLEIPEHNANIISFLAHGYWNVMIYARNSTAEEAEEEEQHHHWVHYYNEIMPNPHICLVVPYWPLSKNEVARRVIT